MEHIGSQEAGYIKIERRGYLSSGEKSFVQQAIASDDGTIRIIALARQISSDNNISLESAYQDVIKIISGSLERDERLKQIEIQYFTDFTELLNSLSMMQAKEQLITALCLLRYRVNPELDVNDVMELHPDIISGLAELYRDEEKRSIEKFEQTTKDTESTEQTGAVDTVDVVAIEKKRSRRVTAPT